MPLEAHIAGLIERRNSATSGVIMGMTTEIRNYMRSSARWRDRTGRARATLQATAVLPAVGGGRGGHSTWELMLYYQVPYGKWLETHHGAAYGHRAGMSEAALMERGNAGRLAVLWPTLDVYLPRVRRAVHDTRASSR